jgi:hypothetical protein
MTRWHMRRSAARGDEGVGLLLVIGTTTVVTMLMIVLTTMATRALTSSSTHVSFEGALSAAESGVDEGLARAQKIYDALGQDNYAFPSSTEVCGSYTTVNWNSSAAPDGTAAPGSFASAAQGLAVERAWAKSWLQTLGANAGCRFAGPKGSYTFFKPVGHQSIYGMGWSPSYSSGKMRYLKSEYLFTAFSPTNAILTQGNLDISGSTTVTTAAPYSPSLASVHANGDITVGGSAAQVYGPVSASGSGSLATGSKFYGNTGGQVVRSTSQGVPFVSARQVWGRQHANSLTNLDTWYDLCGDGSARQPTPATAAPCDVTGTDDPYATNGTTAQIAANGNSFRGWKHDTVNGVSTWYATSVIKGSNYHGIYYIDGGDVVDIAGNSGTPTNDLTVIASATSSDCNSKQGGNITWSHTDAYRPALQGTFMLADSDLQITANVSLGQDINGVPDAGLFIAGDQIDLETSSNGIYGAVVASDQCTIAGSNVSINEIKNPALWYAPNTSAPFVDVVNTTLWLEFAG